MHFRSLIGKLRKRQNQQHSSEFRVYELTWSIPSEFGGMTSVMLRRARNLVRLQGFHVDILTLDYKFDLRAGESRLSASGELIDGVRVRNVWHEVSRYDDQQLKELAGSPPVEGMPADYTAETVHRTRRFVEHQDAEGNVQRIDHLRGDGSVFLIDDRTGDKRRLVLLGKEGKPVGEFSRARDFYFAWFDEVTNKQSSIFINESKFVGSFLHHYRRRHVRIGQVLHNTHIEPKSPSHYGPFTKSRIGVLTNWTKFDFLVFLTQRQKDDFVQAFGDSPSLYVIPNCTAIEIDEVESRESRDTSSGAVVARLVGQKQIDHAILAVGKAEHEVTLNIYGDGDRRQALEDLVASDPRLGSRVRFRGFVDNAADNLSKASFILLTSAFDGLSLVLIEAMSRGCIPIAYDIRYGPSEVIDHEVNGFLTHGIEDTAATIDKLMELDRSEVEGLREAARKKSLTFNDENVTERWMMLFRDLLGRGPVTRTPLQGSVSVDELKIKDETLELSLALHGFAAGGSSADCVVFTTRGGRFSIAFPIVNSAVIVPNELIRLASPGSTFDVWHQHWDGHRVERRRVAHAGDESDVETDQFKAYSTIHGNLSLTIASA